MWCSECGCDRILLQNTLSSLLQTGAAPAPVTADEPTRMVPPVRQEEPTRAVPPLSGRQARPAPAPAPEEDEDVIVAPPRGAGRSAGQPARNQYQARTQYSQQYEEQYDEPEKDPRDAVAEQIIRWAPPITAVLCAIVFAVGFLLTM